MTKSNIGKTHHAVLNVEYDVLAIPNAGRESIHVETSGAVPDGTRTDVETGEEIRIIGRVSAPTAEKALSVALIEFDNS